MTHLTHPTPAARSALRVAGVLGLECALTVVVLVAASTLVGTWA